MSAWPESVVSFSALPEVAALLLAPDPAWIFSRDGCRVVWANPAGGAHLGASSLFILAERRWAGTHPLRRELEALVRSLPERGALARLRLLDTPHGLPVACRCRRIRAGLDRGVLLVATEPAPAPPSPSELAAFFSGGDASAAVYDSAGGLLAGAAPEEGTAVGCDAQIDIPTATGKMKLRLWQAAPETSAAAESEELGPAATAVNAIPLRRDPELPAPSAPRGEPPAAPAPLAPPASEPAAPPPRRDRGARVKSVAPHAGRRAPAGEETAPAAEPGTPGQLQPEPRPRIMAGRVARELSRKPVRFLWQTDAADRFLFVSPGLAQVVGRNAEIIGERWQDAAARLRLDPEGRVANALAQRDTWSGQTAWWPIEGSNVRVPAELTALPVFAADHSFQGYRGFGVLKPAEALMPAAFEARFGAADRAPPPAEQLPPYEEAIATTAANVVPIRSDRERSDGARLSAQERSAFEEIAAALRQRVVNEPLSGEPVSAALKPEEENLPAPASPAAAAGEPAVFELFRRVQDALPDKDPPAEVVSQPELSETHSIRGGEGEPAPEPSAEPAAANAPSPPPEAPLSAARREAAQEGSGKPEARERPAPRPDPYAGEAQRRIRELTAILDTAMDGVVMLDGEGRIESVNASAEALFGLEAAEMQGTDFAELLTPETRQAARDYLSGLKENGVASLLNEGREVAAIAGAGSIPLFLSMGRISGDGEGRFCAVLRDITHWKRTEAELVAAKRAAEAASSQKSEFLARVSHEVRTPLNAIIGFAEVMIEERFGPVENERYREYLRDIRTSGEHVVSLVNDLLDISKIEAGKLDLNFQAVPLNELVRECIGLMQPQANRAHVVLRSSLAKDVPAIVADQRTLRQIVLNLLSNSVKFTGPGGQVITSTSLAETGEAVLRIRDTGEGMSAEELVRALEPFRQIATASLADRTGTGLGLPLTKALVEANRASFAIRSARGEGTVVTITFPPTRVLSE